MRRREFIACLAPRRWYHCGAKQGGQMRRIGVFHPFATDDPE
jgi:hypothetical protein